MLVNMAEMLAQAQQNQYAVGYFNAVNVEMARAVVETAEEMRSPVIVGTAEILLPSMELRRVAEYLLPLAEQADVPVCVHYDHGLCFERCMEALRLGFTSIMYDLSTSPYEENVAGVAELCRIAHAMGVTVEAELGHVGDTEGAGCLENPQDYFTDPKTAGDFVKQTGVDALAVAIGNAHGPYKMRPELDFDRIVRIREETGVPLVLHGGSGLSDDDFREAIRLGVNKVNIFTDLDKAGAKGLQKGLEQGVQNIFNLIPFEIEEMKNVVREKLTLFGSIGRC